MPDNPDLYRITADGVLALHVLFVAFVVFGLVLVIVGGMRGWQWVRNPWFRWTHVAAIGIVVAQAWLGIICPLTTLEMALRERAGKTVYGDTFISHWLGELLYYQAPAWVFAVCYTLFGFLVAASWFRVRPRSLRSRFGTRGLT